MKCSCGAAATNLIEKNRTDNWGATWVSKIYCCDKCYEERGEVEDD